MLMLKLQQHACARPDIFINFKSKVLLKRTSYIELTLIKNFNVDVVIKFDLEVEEVINMIAKNVEIGSRYKNTPYRKLIIAPQTILFYRKDNLTEVVYLNLFWLNRKNPIFFIGNRLKEKQYIYALFISNHSDYQYLETKKSICFFQPILP